MNNLFATIQHLTQYISSIELPDFELPTITLPDFELPTITLPDFELPTITLPEMNFELPQLPQLPIMEFSFTTLLLINSLYILTFYSFKWYNNYQHSKELKSLQKIIDGHQRQVKRRQTTFNNKIKQYEETLRDNETLINILQKRRNKVSNYSYTQEDINDLQKQINSYIIKYENEQDLTKELEFNLQNEQVKSFNFKNEKSFLEYQLTDLKQTSDKYYIELKGKNKTLKGGCKDLLIRLDELVETNKELKEAYEDIVDENEDLKQELVEVGADDFDNSKDLERLTNLNKILEQEVIEQKVEIIKLRKSSRPNYKC